MQNSANSRSFCDDVSYVESPEYFCLDVVVGQSVELFCNTSLTFDIMWTYDTDDGYVDYLYWNGLIDSSKPRLSVKATADDFHSLVVSDTELKDGGLYNCYNGQGMRIVGYRLITAGMSSIYCDAAGNYHCVIHCMLPLTSSAV